MTSGHENHSIVYGNIQSLQKLLKFKKLSTKLYPEFNWNFPLQPIL